MIGGIEMVQIGGTLAKLLAVTALVLAAIAVIDESHRPVFAALGLLLGALTILVAPNSGSEQVKQ